MTINVEPKKDEKPKRRRSPTSLIYLTVLIDSTGYGIVIPLLPFYTEHFGVGSAALGLLVASFAFMQFIFNPIMGRTSDKLGRKPVLIVSLLISVVSFLVFAVAASFLVLLLSRVVAGLATERAVSRAYIVDTVDKEERTASLGKAGAAHGLGYIIGPAIGGLLSGYGFATAGYVAAILNLLNLVFVMMFLPESVVKRITPVLSDSSLISENSQKEGSFSRALKFVGETFRMPGLGVILGVSFLVTLAFSSAPVIIPYVGIDLLTFGPTEIAYFFVYLGVVQILLQGLAIRPMVRKYDEVTLIVGGPLLMACGMILMPSIPTVLIFIISLTIVAFSTGVVRTVVPSLISRIAPDNKQGMILGVGSSIESISAVPGPLIGGFLYEFTGLASPFYVNALLMVLSSGVAFLFLRRISTIRNSEPTNVEIDDST